jgi:hypothetical protein
MTTVFRTPLRTSRAQAVITDAGAAAKLRIYSGTRPAATPGAGALPAATGTLLATLTFGSVIGTAAAGAIDWDEAGATQTNSAHVNGTPGWARIEQSGGTAVMDIDIAAGAGNWQFTGTVANGQNVVLTSLVLTDGNAGP